MVTLQLAPAPKEVPHGLTEAATRVKSKFPKVLTFKPPMLKVRVEVPLLVMVKV
jgi:hypothetical protein